MSDNWKHRSANMLCRTCMYFVAKEAPKPAFRFLTKDQYQAMKEAGTVQELTEDQLADMKIGRCRRHAPTMSGWPVMFKSDWCGDHKLDENKI